MELQIALMKHFISKWMTVKQFKACVAHEFDQRDPSSNLLQAEGFSPRPYKGDLVLTISVKKSLFNSYHRPQ